MYEAVSTTLAPGWRVVSPDDVPEEMLGGVREHVRYIAAAIPEVPSYAPTLVVVSVPIAAGEDPGEALRGSGRTLMNAIPGMRLIDDQEGHGSLAGRRMRTGVYILDSWSLTVLQMAWLVRGTDDLRLWTATITGLTQEFGERYQSYLDMMMSLEVHA